MSWFCYRFYTEIVRQGVLIPCRSRFEQPAHTIFLCPAIVIENLLPADIHYTISGQKGFIKASNSTTIHNVLLLIMLYT